jgi:hypothetical protein
LACDRLSGIAAVDPQLRYVAGIGGRAVTVVPQVLRQYESK